MAWMLLAARMTLAFGCLRESTVCANIRHRTHACTARGPPVDPCVCAEGFAALGIYYQEDGGGQLSGHFHYCCQKNISVPPSAFCVPPEAHQNFFDTTHAAAIPIFILGLLGTGLFTFLIHMRRRPIPLKEEDEEFVSPKTRGDGKDLHSKIAPHSWCVTLSDLQQLRRLVMHAVSAGLILPTELDGFEVGDLLVGPSVYTVTEQFLKPRTAEAGKMSWALLKHPDGLACDVFVTHAWAEGIYEFIARVEHSWPKGRVP